MSAMAPTLPHISLSLKVRPTMTHDVIIFIIISHHNHYFHHQIHHQQHQNKKKILHRNSLDIECSHCHALRSFFLTDNQIRRGRMAERVNRVQVPLIVSLHLPMNKQLPPPPPYTHATVINPATVIVTVIIIIITAIITSSSTSL